jgi:tetratricopeptide (TPR) repeat protein
LELEQQRRADQPISQSMRPARAWALTNMVALTGHILQTLDERSYNFPAMLDESLAFFNQMGENGKRGLVITNFWLVSLFYDNLDDQFDQLERLFTEFEALGDKSYMAICLLFQGIADYDHPEKHYQKAISLCEEIGDRELIPFLWASLGSAAYLQGKPEKAKSYVVEAVNILKDVENDLLASVFTSYAELGHLSWRMGEYCQAKKYYQSVINISKNQHLYIRSEIFLCCIAMSQGDYHKARVLLNNIYLSLREKRNFGRIWFFPFVVRILAELESWTGNYAQADQWLTELKEIDATVNIDRMNLHRAYLYTVLAKVAISKMNWYVAAEHVRSALNSQIQTPVWSDGLYEHKNGTVTLAGVLASALGKPEKAARLLGTADRSYRLHRLTFPLFRRQLIDQTIDDTRTALDEATFTTAWEEGKAMDLNEALAYALQVVEEIQTSI